MRRWRKILSLILVLGLVASESTQALASFAFAPPTQSYADFSAYQGIKVFVNGRYVEFNDDLGYPIAINGQTYIPVRVVSETFNAYIYWRDWDQTVCVNKHGKHIEIKLGENYINKLDLIGNAHEVEKIQMDASAFAQNGRTYIPLRALFEGFDMTVIWDGDTQTVHVAGDYEKNTEYIDFKTYKILDIKDVDLEKDYAKIMYDGQEISKDYIKVLNNSAHYRVLEDGNTLNIFSYQYLFDLNYLYRALCERKNNTTKEKEYYTLWNISEEAYEFVTRVSFIDDRFGHIFTRETELSYSSGKAYDLESATDPEKYVEIDKVADEIVSRVNAAAKSDEEKVRMVNDEMCEIMEYKFETGPIYTSLYSSLVSPRTVVCQGYATTFKYLMDKLGIDCIIASGTNERSKGPHAWNEVLINGEWKIVDVSSNDVDSRNYILLTDYDEIDYFTASDIEKECEQLVKYTLKLNNTG